MGRHDHALCLAEREHDLAVVLGLVQQCLELAHRIMGGAPVFACPPAVMLSGLSMLTRALAVSGRYGAIICNAPALLRLNGLVVLRGGIEPFGRLISLLRGSVSLGGDLIPLHRTAII